MPAGCIFKKYLLIKFKQIERLLRVTLLGGGDGWLLGPKIHGKGTHNRLHTKHAHVIWHSEPALQNFLPKETAYDAVLSLSNIQTLSCFLLAKCNYH